MVSPSEHEVEPSEQGLQYAAKLMEPLILIVGENSFTTTRQTLASEPGFRLSALAGVDLDPTKNNSASDIKRLWEAGASRLPRARCNLGLTDRYYIDRDGKHFKHILNYVRSGNIFLPKSNNSAATAFLTELLFEAYHYQLRGLVSKLCVAILGPDYHELAAEDLILGEMPSVNEVV